MTRSAVGRSREREIRTESETERLCHAKDHLSCICHSHPDPELARRNQPPLSASKVLHCILLLTTGGTAEGALIAAAEMLRQALAPVLTVAQTMHMTDGLLEERSLDCVYV